MQYFKKLSLFVLKQSAFLYLPGLGIWLAVHSWHIPVSMFGSVASSDPHGSGSDQARPSQPSWFLILSFECPSGAAEELGILLK